MFWRARRELELTRAALATALAERDAYLQQRDVAIGERNEFLRQRDEALGERNEFLRQRDLAQFRSDEYLRADESRAASATKSCAPRQNRAPAQRGYGRT